MKFKTILIKILDVTSTTILRWKSTIEVDNNIHNPNKYEDLTPVDDVNQSQNYLDTLNWALQNPNVKNVAVTGPYGSGKSSILKTFEKKFPLYSCLKISLASFQDDTPEEKDQASPTITRIRQGDSFVEDRHRLIELSILQQMFYRVKGKDIPDSRFIRIRKIGTLAMTLRVIIVFMTLIGLSLLFTPAFYNGFQLYNTLHEPFCDLPQYLGTLLIFPAIIILSAFTFRLLNTSKFNKINLIKGELEFDPKSETSILNKHIDEILYFFQATPFDVVFIEDLDRFNDPEIFTKLREINLLINNADQINKKVTFVYAIKDDMFKDKSRTKFFDFIMPIIPVINSSNSYEQIHEKIFSSGNEIDIKENFLSNVTLYIDDMRVLKNIYNEFMLYRSTLNNIKLKDDHLFAMIVYKNIYPNDFAKLHRNEGVLFKVFNQIDRIKEKLIESKTEAIKLEKRKLTEIENSGYLTIAQLRSGYLVEILSDHANAIGLVVDGQEKALASIRDSDEAFRWISEQAGISYYYHNPTYNRIQTAKTNKSFIDIQNKVSPGYTYVERERDLKENVASGTKKIEEKILILEKDIQEIRGLTLSKLLNKENWILTEFDEDFQKSDLLVYLTRNGFINESYSYLISYFYPGSLSINDANFALSVANHDTLPFDFELTKVPKLLERLKPEDFKEESILNFKLTDYVASHPSKYKNHFENLLDQFSKETKSTINFYNDYIDRSVTSTQLVRGIFKSWNRLGEFIIKDSGYTKVRIIEHLKFISRFGGNDDLVKLNRNGVITNFIANSGDFISYFQETTEMPIAKNLIENLNVKFISINDPSANPSIFNYIYENDSYEINDAMVGLMLKVAANDEITDAQIETANLTTIRASNALKLLNYVEENVAIYIDKVLLASVNNICESEDTIVWVLNSDSDIISQSQKVRIIQQQKQLINDINKVSDKTIWPYLLHENKLSINWKNVISYFESSLVLDEHLLKYLNQKEVYLTLKNGQFIKESSAPKETLYKFSEQILTTNNIGDAAYLELLNSNSYYYNRKLAVENISEVKLAGLITGRKIRLNKEMFDVIRESFAGKMGIFIESNIDDYLKSPEIYEITLDEFNFLLNSSILSKQEKKQLITELDIDDLLANKQLSKSIGLFYVNQPYQSLSWEFLHEIFKAITLENKTILLEKYLQSLDPTQIHLLIEEMTEPYARLNLAGKQTLLPYNDLNKSIVKQLEDKNYVRRKTKVEKDKIRVYNKLR